MKKKIFLLSLIAIFLCCGCGKVSKLSNGNDAVVSFTELESISVDSLYEEIKDRYAVSILIDMIDREILNKEYESKLDEASTYASDQIKTLKKSYNSEEELLKAVQSYYGYNTLNEFEDYIKLNYLRDLATTDYAKSKVTDKEIEKYYENDIKGDIEASHILIVPVTSDDMTEEEKKNAENDALNKAKEAIKELNNGAEFSEVAKKYSDDEQTKENGGSLGQFSTGQMVSEFEDAAFSLKLNEYTKEPVKTSYGYHIILKTKEYEKDTLENVKDSIIESLAQEKITNTPTISITALTDLRKNKGMNIEDSNINSNYNKYINSLYNYYNSNNAK